MYAYTDSHIGLLWKTPGQNIPSSRYNYTPTSKTNAVSSQ